MQCLSHSWRSRSASNPSSCVSRPCRETVSSKVLSRYGIGLSFAFALLVFVLVLLIFATTAFLAFPSNLLVAFALLAFAFAQHRESHGYNVGLRSVRVKQHRPELRVAFQDV